VERFIVIVAVKDGEGNAIKLLSGRFESQADAVAKAREDFGSIAFCTVAYSAKEFEEVSQQLLTAEPDPPWKRVSPN
jgi:hypothetical protein